mgnify:CR=1 FL=1
MWRIAGDDTPPVLTAEGNIQSGHSERITLELPKTAIVFFMGKATAKACAPVGAVLTILAARLVIPALPYLLSFAAGAMLYVVVEELIPEMSQGKHSNLGTVFFAVGFSIMMALDVALG